VSAELEQLAADLERMRRALVRVSEACGALRQITSEEKEEREAYWRKYHGPDNDHLFWGLGQDPIGPC
jgi:hypothetical protein